MGKHLQQMATQGEHFFRIILPEILEKTTLELPINFVMEHWEHLPKDVSLRVPTGEESKMELKRFDGRAWLHKGWQNFVDKYSIQCGYFLVFKYEGESRFDVMIFDLSTSEIKYPVSVASSSNTKKAGEHIQVKEEDDTDDDFEILDEFPQKVGKSSRKFRTGHHFYPMKNKSSLGGDQVIERANLHFTVIMRSTYISCSFLYIPEHPASSYFRERGNNRISLLGADGRDWSMKCNIGAPPTRRVRLYSGWAKFSQENLLQEGDVCTFDLVKNTAMTFKVSISRVTEEGVKTHVASSGNKRVTSRAMERAKSFKCKNPHFMIRIGSSYISSRPKVHIPSAYSKRYLLKESKHGENVIILHDPNGEKWPVHYYRSVQHSVNFSFTRGWKNFASENRLRVGDILVFEMIIEKTKAFKVTIFRVTDNV